MSVIEVRTEQTATVSWCDPLSGHYGHQTWRVALAKQGGICVLSGRSVERGDFIYRPATCQPPPGNAGAMILASQLVVQTDKKPSNSSDAWQLENQHSATSLPSALRAGVEVRSLASESESARRLGDGLDP